MTILKGIIIGLTMMIPGLSGGSCAMVLNIYDKMIKSMAEINKNFKENFIFLLKIGLSIILGVILFSLYIYRFTALPYFNYLVVFIILLNILFLKIKVKFNLNNIILLLIGMFLLNILQKTNITINFDNKILPYLITGILLAISLILPGLGITYILYIINLYDIFNLAIINLDYLFIIKISLSTLFGIIITVKFINYLLKKNPQFIYSLVIGILIGSLDLGFSTTIEIINTFIVGIILIFSNRR